MAGPEFVRLRKPDKQRETGEVSHKRPQKFQKTRISKLKLPKAVKANTKDTERNAQSEEAVRKAEKDFALDLPMLVDETAGDMKILNAIAAVEKGQFEDIFYPYRPKPKPSYHLIRASFQ